MDLITIESGVRRTPKQYNAKLKQEETTVMVLVKDGVEVLDPEDIVCSGCEIIEICPHADPALTLCPIGWNDEESED